MTSFVRKWQTNQTEKQANLRKANYARYFKIFRKKLVKKQGVEVIKCSFSILKRSQISCVQNLHNIYWLVIVDTALLKFVFFLFIFQLYGLEKGASSLYLIESTILNLKGILDLSLLSDGSHLTCVYNSEYCGPRDIKSAVEKIGFQAVLHVNRKKDDFLNQASEIKQLVSTILIIITVIYNAISWHDFFCQNLFLLLSWIRVHKQTVFFIETSSFKKAVFPFVLIFLCVCFFFHFFKNSDVCYEKL